MEIEQYLELIDEAESFGKQVKELRKKTNISLAAYAINAVVSVHALKDTYPDLVNQCEKLLKKSGVKSGTTKSK